MMEKRVFKQRNYFLNVPILVIITITTITTAVMSADLENYPEMFFRNDLMNVEFVIGEFAATSDVIAAVEIANSLQEDLEIYSRTQGSRNFEIETHGNTYEELRDLYMDVFLKKTQGKSGVAPTLLDTSLNRTSIRDRNLIVVGGPCVNWVAAHVMNNPIDCAQDFIPGSGYIRVYPNGRGIIMLVAGYSADDTMTAAQIASNHHGYRPNFVGSSFRISSAVITQRTIR